MHWEWYKDTNAKSVFIHCLLKANWEDRKWQNIEIKRGSFITSVETLATELSLSVQQTKTAISKLKSTNEITSTATNKFTLLTVVKYEDYQSNSFEATSKVTSKSTNKQPTNNQQPNQPITTTNNIINNNTISNINILNSSLLSEIKISDCGGFLISKTDKIKVDEKMVLYFQTAKAFRQLFIKNLKEKNSPYSNQQNAKFGAYVNPIRLMFEKKEATSDQIKEAYEFLNSIEGEFWKANILCTVTLRKQISKLIVKKNSQQTPLENGKQLTSATKKPFKFTIAGATETLIADAQRKLPKMEGE